MMNSNTEHYSSTIETDVGLREAASLNTASNDSASEPQQEVDTNQYGLNRLHRVILLNSYIRGKFEVLTLDENCILTGSNGSGKTTLMGAIIPFYGTALGKITKESDAKSGFVRHYLQFSNSYIVYEYIRAGNKKCAILRNNNNIAEYNLVDAPFNKDWFMQNVEGSLKFLEYPDVLRNINDDGIYVSSNLKPSVYEAIISNAPSNTLRGNARSEAKTVTRLKRDFSLAQNKGSFYNFSDIASNILQNKIEFKEICEFLVEGMKMNKDINSEEIIVSDNYVDISKWARQRETLSIVEKNKPSFAKLETELSQNKQNQQLLAQSVANLNAICERFRVLIEQKESSLVECKKKSANLSIEASSLDNKYTSESESLKYKLASEISKIKNLEDRRHAFEHGTNNSYPVAKLEKMVGELPDLERLKEDKQSSLSQYEKDAEDAKRIIESIDNLYEKTVRQIQDELRSSQNSIEKQMLEKRNHASETISKLNEEKHNKTHETRINKDIEIKSAVDALNQLMILKSSKSQELKSVSIKQEFLDSKERLQAKSFACSDELTKNNNLKSKLDNELSELKEERKDKERLIESANAKIKRLSGEAESLRVRIKGDTLYSFLLQSEADESRKHQVIQIRKTINHTLLDRTDLNPIWDSELTDIALDASQSNATYGLNISTNNIADADRMSLVDINLKIEEIESDILSTKDDIESYSKELAGIRAKLDANKEALTQCNITSRRIEGDLADIKAQIQRINIQAEEDKAKRIDTLKQELSKVESSITDSEQVIDNKNNELKSEINAIQTDYAAKTDKVRVQLDESIQLLKDKLLNQNKIADDKIKSAEAERKEAIANNGYDDSILVKLSDEVKDLERRISDAHKALDKLGVYRDFMQNEHPQISVFNKNKAELETSIIETESTYRNTKALKIQEIQAVKTEISVLSSDLEVLATASQKTQSKLAYAKQHQNLALVSNEFNHPSYEHANIDEILLFADESLIASEKLIRKTRATVLEGINLLKIIKTPFSNNSNMFEELMSSDVAKSTINEDNWFIQAPLFISYLENEHETKKRLISTHYRLQADYINGFKLELDDAHEALQSISKVVNRSFAKICQNLQGLVVESLSMRLDSIIKENDWYVALERFSQEYERWVNEKAVNSSELPSLELLNSLDRVQNTINRNRININLSEQFTFSLKYKEKGQLEKTVKRSKAFKDLGSTGTSRITQIIIYLSLIDVINTAKDTDLKLFIDEVLVLDKTNTKEMLLLLEKYNISCVCAAPEKPDDDLLPLFSTNIACQRDYNKNEYSLAQTGDMESLSHKTLLANNDVFSI